MVETLENFLYSAPWYKYFYGSLVILSLYCPLADNINTDNLYRLFGFFLVALGGTVAFQGQQNMTVWAGVILVFLTYLIDWINKAKYKFPKYPKYDKRSKP